VARAQDVIIIERNIAEVWELIRPLDFSWLPSFARVESNEKGGTSKNSIVGDIKNIIYDDQTRQKIKIQEVSEQNHCISWNVISSDPPSAHSTVLHTIKLRRTNSDTTSAEWTTDFSQNPKTNAIEDMRHKQRENLKHLNQYVSGFKLAVFLDGSPQSDKAFAKALSSARPQDILFLVNIPQPLNPFLKGLVVAETLDPNFFNEIQTQQEEASVLLLESYRERCKEAKVQHVYGASLKPKKGNVKETAVRFLTKRKIDLAFVGTKGHGEFVSFFLGSFSRYLLNHAPCSVMVSR